MVFQGVREPIRSLGKSRARKPIFGPGSPGFFRLRPPALTRPNTVEMAERRRTARDGPAAVRHPGWRAISWAREVCAGELRRASRALLDGPMSSSPSDKYRPDIDGLRAIAVMLVVNFHAFPEALPGGFHRRRYLLRDFRLSDHRHHRARARSAALQPCWLL
jgi:hypothetical protein